MKLPFVAREALESAEVKLAELNQEYQNFRRRNASVQEDSYFQGGSDALKAMLPIYDNLTLALEQPCEDEAFRTGIEMTRKTLEKAFAQLDVQEIPALNAPSIPSCMKLWSISKTRTWRRIPWSASSAQALPEAIQFCGTR